ncbi:putative acetyltransferase [Actinomadura coerulea]|uniref:putative acetyltransferase n=1 Tax=Actinomadura coerulea TaxID=46159 RepID=UPI00343D408A
MSGRFAARLVVAISGADVGQRISLRRRLPTGEYSDVVGVLESWSGGTLAVRHRTGELVEVPESAMVAAKVVPPQPPPRRRPRREEPEDG